MRILAVETSRSRGSVAILDNENIIKENTLNEDLTHAKILHKKILETLEAVGMKLGGIELIAVDIGPGSYTGIRVGVTSAKVLSYVQKLPIVGVSSLEALAHDNNTPIDHRFIAPVLDAKWKEIYYAIYERDSKELIRVKPDAICTPTEIFGTLPDDTVLIGTGISELKGFNQSGKKLYFYDTPIIPRASTVGVLGFRYYLKDHKYSSHELNPLYLRPSEAEVKLGIEV